MSYAYTALDQGTEQGARLGGVWQKRSRLEQVLLALFTCAIIAIFGLSIAVGVRRKVEVELDEHDIRVNHTFPNNTNSDESSDKLQGIREVREEAVCTSPSCVIAAADLFKSMDLSEDPCDDFYNYACQSWIEDTTIIEQVSDRFSALSEKMSLKLKDLLEQEVSANSSVPKHFAKAQKFYHSCNNWTKREEEGLTPFLKDVKYFGGFPALMGNKWSSSDFDYIEMLRRLLDRGYDNGVLLSVNLERDYKNNSIERILIHQTQPGMNQQTLFKDETAMLIYTTYTCLYAEHLCLEEPNCTLSHEKITADIKEAIQLEKNITDMLYSSDYFTNKENSYNIMTIRKLTAIANETDWLRLLKVYFPNITTINADTEIMVTAPEFMKNFSRFISSANSSPEGRRRLANYMVYRQVKDAATHLSKDIKRAYYDFQGQLKGYVQIPDLWSECVSFTAAVFDLSLGSQYIDKFFPKERKQAIEDLVEKIKVELESILLHTTWMDPMTQERALKKLHKIYLMAVYPDGLLNDTKLDEWYEKLNVGDSHYENYVRSHLFLYEKQVEGYGSLVDPANWKYLPSSILESNAYYSGLNNSVFVPLGISQSWFFEEKGPLYVNYGRMGFVLAHEMSHAFDVKGADLDERGNWDNWWENETLQHFRNQSKCMIDMFDQYFSKEANLTLNGSRTLPENTADDVGISEVYAAFTKANGENPAPTLPGHNLTAKQLFWVNYASIWCEKDTNDYYFDLITRDEHPPSKYRVNSPLSNNKDFLIDFKCQAGQKMFPNRSPCHVWGDPNDTLNQSR